MQLKAGHSSGAITERYVHAAQVLFPGEAKGEERMFGELAFVDEVERGARRTDG